MYIIYEHNTDLKRTFVTQQMETNKQYLIVSRAAQMNRLLSSTGIHYIDNDKILFVSLS